MSEIQINDTLKCRKPHSKPVRSKDVPRAVTANFTSDNMLILSIPETTDFQREAVKLLQDAGFSVYASVSTRERLTAEKSNNPLTMIPKSDMVPYGYINDVEEYPPQKMKGPNG